jgi:hypothetical protein
MARVLGVLLIIVVAVAIGAAAYNAGVSAGITEGAQQALASGDAVPAGPYGYGYGYGPYWHPFGFGWGFFGIIFWILGIFLVIGLIRFAFGSGRGGHGPRGPGGHGGWSGRRESVEEWHRELHRRDGPDAADGEGRPATP